MTAHWHASGDSPLTPFRIIAETFLPTTFARKAGHAGLTKAVMVARVRGVGERLITGTLAGSRRGRSQSWLQLLRPVAENFGCSGRPPPRRHLSSSRLRRGTPRIPFLPSILHLTPVSFPLPLPFSPLPSSPLRSSLFPSPSTLFSLALQCRMFI